MDAHLSLQKLSDITEIDIMNIWIKPGEPTDISNLVYDYDIPLYQKMIFRFRNGFKSPAFLYNGIDPNNQNILLKYFGLPPLYESYNGIDPNNQNILFKHFKLQPLYESYNGTSIKEFMDYLVWIRSMYCPYKIKELCGNDKDTLEKYMSNWNTNEIKFYLGLTDEHKAEISTQYQQEINRLNTIFEEMNQEKN